MEGRGRISRKPEVKEWLPLTPCRHERLGSSYVGRRKNGAEDAEDECLVLGGQLLLRGSVPRRHERMEEMPYRVRVAECRGWVELELGRLDRDSRGCV